MPSATESAPTRRLELGEKHEVRYCIPLWLRDEQIKRNVRAVPGRIREVTERRADPIAIVCFGPSLRQTWEEIRSFKYVMTCSGAHKFLLERGIVPTWHVEVDPRRHKIDLLGEPHSEVTYLPCSTVHPEYLDWLKSHDAKIELWHVFASDEEAVRVLPRGEWALTGGANAGLRCLTIARFFGFTDLHVFGMDGSASPGEEAHAAAHPNEPAKYAVTEYNGKQFYTTSGMLECAKQTWHELDQLPDVKATFHGEGLVQEMAKDYVRRDGKASGILGVNTPELISSDYAEQNRQLFDANMVYGVGGGRHAPVVERLVEKLSLTSVLDYGCGRGFLAKELKFPIWEYDPCVPGKEAPPRPADLVVCTDVLEHVEPDKLDFVLADLRRCTRRIGYFVISTGPAQKSLPDGRNTHLIQEGREWWVERLRRFFTLPDNAVTERGASLVCVVATKPKKP